MRKILFIAVTSILLFSTIVVAQDFGGSIANTSSITTSPSAVFSDTIEAKVWWHPKLGDFSRFDLEVAFTQPLTTDEVAQPLLPKFPFTLDINTLSYTGRFPRLGPGLPLISFEAGRFAFGGPTGYVLAGKLDGLRFGFTFPAMELRLGLGYSGFLWRQTSGIMMSKTDQIASIDEDKIFGSPRLIGTFRYTLFNIFRQQLVLSFIFQEDLRDIGNPSVFIEPGTEEENPSKGGPLDTQYISLNLRGGIIQDLYYNVFGSFGTGRVLSFMPDSESETGGSYQYSTKLSFLTGFRLNYYLKELLFSSFMLEFVYASGDKDSDGFLEGNRDGFSTNFLPITGAGLGAVFAPSLGNLTYGQLKYSLKPFSNSDVYVLTNFQASAQFFMFFRSQKEGPISEEATIAAHDSPYLGSELDISANFRPFSDLGSSLTLGIFLPSNQFAESYDKVRLLVKLKASISY